LLWLGNEDLKYLDQIKLSKRESRMARERSEDALTWNIFRFFEREGLLTEFVRFVAGSMVENPDLIYWSYSAITNTAWTPLLQARSAFGEEPDRGSEPDLILNTDDSLVFIEVKFTSSNYKRVDSVSKLPKYVKGENGWYDQVFTKDIFHVAIYKKCYELMRFWLLGTWMAEQMDKDFMLLSLTPMRIDPNLTDTVTPMIQQNNRRRFKRITWEDIYSWIRGSVPKTQDRERVLIYLEQKTAGYVGGRLQKAFQIEG
jgi:hypothetical protein